MKMNDNGIAAVFGSGMVEDCPLWVIQSPTATMECSRDGRRSLMAFVGLEEIPDIDGFRPVKTTLKGSAELAVQLGLQQVTICLRKASDGTIPTKSLSLHEVNPNDN
jgi:hypothetical protein